MNYYTIGTKIQSNQTKNIYMIIGETNEEFKLECIVCEDLDYNITNLQITATKFWLEKNVNIIEQIKIRKTENILENWI